MQGGVAVLPGCRFGGSFRVPPDKRITSRWFGRTGFRRLRGDGSQVTFIRTAALADRSRGRGPVNIAVACFCLLLALATTGWPQETGSGSGFTFTIFDAPGAGTGAYAGTAAFTMNMLGDVTGSYEDNNNVGHGFVRLANGTLTTFDAPGAGTYGTEGTFAISINASDVIAGYLSDTNSVYHGLVRASNGSITEFDVPGADEFDGHLGTAAASINASGVITGIWRDDSLFCVHGFVRAANGTITKFDVSDVCTFNGDYTPGTEPIAINTAGDVAGTYIDPNNGAYHGFVRAANGTITTFDAPGAGTGTAQGTVAISINSAGVIAGTYEDANGVAHGFVRATDGTITTFDAPGAGSLAWIASLGRKGSAPPLQGTYGFSVNDAGAIAGTYLDASMVLHGFVRTAAGDVITSLDAPGAGTGGLQGTLAIGINTAGNITGGYLDSSNVAHGFVVTGAPVENLQFVAVVPCRLVDTRPQNGGGGPIQGGTFQVFNLPQLAQQKSCGDLSTAAAYSLNVTAVPGGPLGYLTIWPTGENQPNISTLNSVDGRVKANAAIVPAGSQGAVSVFVSNTSDVVLDIDGYFAPPASSTLAFYPLTPCRVADTRQGNPFGLGAPFLHGQVKRRFPILNSDCKIPRSSRAYSLNFTAVPHEPLGYLTVWPTGQPQPVVSTLNAVTGTVVANAAIVPAGADGDIDAFASNDTDLLIDVDGYFAVPGPNGLSLYPVTPCRALDTRLVGSGQPFMGELTVNVVGSACGPSSQARAYVFNATVVPSVPLGYLTLWPDGLSQPMVSTLNALDAAVTSNMAIVPTNNGKVDSYVSNLTQLILDISSYFAP